MGDPAIADAVVLAAGRSSRMGVPKGLVLVEDRPWLTWQLNALVEAGVRRSIVVLGSDREQYYRAIPNLAERATVIVNPAPERGPFSSLQCGLAVVSFGQGAYVLPVDVPAATADVWRALAQALGPGVLASLPVFEERGGHPVLLAASFVKSLREAPAEHRLDHALREAGDRVARVVVQDARIGLNLNTPQDWEKYGIPRGACGRPHTE